MSGAHRIAVAALAAALLAFALERGLVVARVAENWTRDLRVATLSPRLPRSEEVVAVRISEDSLAPLPYRSPVDRMFLAGLVETLADKGVRAIGVDLLIDQPTEPGKDAALRTAIDAAGVPVVMAWASPAEGLTQSQARWLDGYLEGLRRGSTVVHADPADGIVRSLPLAPSTPGAPPGLVAAIANAVGLEVPGAPVLKIDYRRGPAADQAFIASYPAHAVAVLPQAWLRGRIALIGVDLALADRHRTPLSALAAHGPGDVSGVMIHAQAMAQILDGRRLSEPRAATQLALLLVAALAGSLLSMVPAPLWAMLALDAMALALIWSGAFWLFGAGGPLVPVVAPSLALTAGTGIAAAFRLRGERATRRFVERAFSKYLAPEVVSRLVAQPDRLTVGGERRVVTFLFTDVADFTTLVEGMEPAPLVDLLNECDVQRAGGPARSRAARGPLRARAGRVLAALHRAPARLGRRLRRDPHRRAHGPGGGWQLRRRRALRLHRAR
jgi:CHASE2 domain-containing sensor protein